MSLAMKKGMRDHIKGDVIIQVPTYLLDLRIAGINLTVAIIGTLSYRCFIVVFKM
jgi:hypothetical protein